MSRAYQARFVDELLPGAWRAGHKSVLLALPVGAGKTKCSRLVTQRLLALSGWDIAVVDHRKELTEQFSAEFADLSPGVFWAGKPSPIPSPLRIGGRDTLIRREWVPLHDKLFLVIDECFVAGTLVDGQPIENIAVGDLVWSATGEGELTRKKVVRTFKKKPAALLKIYLENGTVLVCTPEHPFYTGRAYVPAANLQEGNLIYGQDPSMLLVPSYCQLYNSPSTVCRTSLLLTYMQSSVQSESVQRNCREDKSQIRCGTNASTQSNAATREQRGDAYNTARNKAQAHSAGRQRQTSSSRTSRSIQAINAAFSWLGLRIRGGNGPAKKDKNSSDMLQDRCGASRAQNCCGGGRKQPSGFSSKSTGSKERRLSSFTRVVRVSFPQQGSPEQLALLSRYDYVYNIEVEDTHTYFVNGVLVHNCHHVAQQNTYGKLIQRFRTLYRVVYVLGLTATPYRLDGKPLGKVFDTLIEPTKPGDLIDAGVLMEPVILRRDAPDLEGLHRAAGDFIGTELEMRSRKLVGNVVEELKNWSDGYPAVLRAVSIAHSKTLCERLTAAGFRAAHMDGETSATERDELFARLAIGGQRGAASGIDVLCQVDIASEGWNPPSDYERVLRLPHLWPSSDNPPPYVPLCVLSDCRPTLSRSGYRQFEGRGSRPTGDTIQTSRGPMAALPKPWFRLISHSENWRRFGFLRDHYGFSLETGEVAGEARQPRDKSGLLNCRYCLKCLSVWPNTVQACTCGAALVEPKAAPEETREKLVPVGAAQGATDGQRVGYLVGLWLSHFKKNAARAAMGQPPISERQIAAIYHSYSGRWPTTTDMQAAKAAALATKNAAKPNI